MNTVMTFLNSFNSYLNTVLPNPTCQDNLTSLLDARYLYSAFHWIIKCSKRWTLCPGVRHFKPFPLSLGGTYFNCAVQNNMSGKNIKTKCITF